MKTKSIEFVVYEAPDGKPTCAIDFNTGKFCAFLLSRRLGTEDVCGYRNGPLLERGVSSKGEPGMGYLIPCPSCPLHKSNN